MRYNVYHKCINKVPELTVANISKSPEEAVIQIRKLFPQHSHRIFLCSVEMNRFIWDEVYHYSQWQDRSVFNSAFIDKMAKRFNRFPTHNLYLISQETPDSLPNVLEYGRVCNWCLHFILPEQLRTKINKIIVRQIHEE
jgi:hypothetical protein